MTLSILIWCPDRHILYDGRTPGEVGVGGGITARVRVARALARRGHRVQLWGHCPRHEILDGVEYVPLDQQARTRVDVWIATTSGGAFDLSGAASLAVEARLTLLWVHGPQLPEGAEALEPDAIYAVSNFVCEELHKLVTRPATPIFVSYNGFEAGWHEEAESLPSSRDDYRLIYASHPSKGLRQALEALERLRRREPRFHLAVFGGESLWGEPEVSRPTLPGVDDRGRIGQRALAVEMTRASFSLCLQSRQEPFGYVVTESMRAGCIPVASRVGAYPELIRDRVDGCLIPPGAPADEAAAAADRMVDLIRSPSRLDRIRDQARRVPWSSDLMAATWLEHWGYLLDGRRPKDGAPARCPVCGGVCLGLADGDHCLVCGHFRPTRLGQRADATRASNPARVP